MISFGKNQTVCVIAVLGFLDKNAVYDSHYGHETQNDGDIVHAYYFFPEKARTKKQRQNRCCVIENSKCCQRKIFQSPEHSNPLTESLKNSVYNKFDIVLFDAVLHNIFDVFIHV